MTGKALGLCPWCFTSEHCVGKRTRCWRGELCSPRGCAWYVSTRVVLFHTLCPAYVSEFERCRGMLRVLCALCVVRAVCVKGSQAGIVQITAARARNGAKEDRRHIKHNLYPRNTGERHQPRSEWDPRYHHSASSRNRSFRRSKEKKTNKNTPKPTSHLFPKQVAKVLLPPGPF